MNLSDLIDWIPGIGAVFFSLLCVASKHIRIASFFGMTSASLFTCQLVGLGFDFFALAFFLTSSILFLTFLSGGLYLNWREKKPRLEMGAITAILLLGLVAVLGYSYVSQMGLQLTSQPQPTPIFGISKIGHAFVEKRFLETALLGVSFFVVIIGFSEFVRVKGSLEDSKKGERIK